MSNVPSDFQPNPDRLAPAPDGPVECVGCHTVKPWARWSGRLGVALCEECVEGAKRGRVALPNEVYLTMISGEK